MEVGKSRIIGKLGKSIEIVKGFKGMWVECEVFWDSLIGNVSG